MKIKCEKNAVQYRIRWEMKKKKAKKNRNKEKILKNNVKYLEIRMKFEFAMEFHIFSKVKRNRVHAEKQAMVELLGI